MQLTNTPGIFYAISYWGACFLLVLVSPRRHSLKYRIGFQALFLLILGSLMMLTDGMTNLFFPMMLLYILLMFIDIYHLTHYDIKTSIYFTMRAFIMGEFIASLGWQILYYLNFTQNNYLGIMIYAVVIVPILISFLSWLEKRFNDFNQNIQINTTEMGLAIIIGVAIFSMSNLSYAVGESIFSSNMNFTYEVFLIRTLFDFAGVAILYAYHFQLEQLQTKLEFERMQQLLQMQYSNYEMLEKSIEVINHKYHDLKYQIALLKEETTDDSGLAYLNHMEKEIRLYEAQNQTGNKILDTILTAKAVFCQKNDITMTVIADGALLSFIQPFDLSTLFGNMMDNAIESVQKIEDKERRLIHLLIAKERNFVRIRLENCYEGEMIFEGNLPQTTKEEKDYHGYGLKSIHNIVNKYDGSVIIEANNGWFELRILIPIREHDFINY